MTSSTIRVLLIDDEESDYLMTRALLGQIEGQGTEIEWASTYAQGLRLLSERRHDVCLLDYFLANRTGLELLRQARAEAIRTPIILLTGKGSRHVDIEAMKSGAVDYLEKGHDPEALERALRYAVERHRAQEALRQSEERHRGMFDHLPLGLFRVKESGEYIEANPALIRTLDFPERERLRQIAHSFFVSPPDRERFFQTLTDHGIVLGFETELRTATGRLIRIRNTARAHRGPAGVIEYIEGSVEENSAPAQDQSHEAAAFRAMMSTAKEGVLLVTANGQIVQSNHRAASLLGTDLDTFDGGAIWDHFDPADGAAIASALEEIAGGKKDSLARSARCASGGGSLHTVFFHLDTPQQGDTEVILLLLEEGRTGPEN